jgi:hypothetical protein
MRTTVTLDPDVEVLVRKAMRERGLSFKQALNQAVRAGVANASGAKVEPFRQRSFSLGRPRADLTKALSLAGELDDQHTTRHYRAP